MYLLPEYHCLIKIHSKEFSLKQIEIHFMKELSNKILLCQTIVENVFIWKNTQDM